MRPSAELRKNGGHAGFEPATSRPTPDVEKPREPLSNRPYCNAGISMLTAWCSFGNAPFLTKLCPALNSFSGFGLSIVQIHLELELDVINAISHSYFRDLTDVPSSADTCGIR
jgi:hypothetical protein